MSLDKLFAKHVIFTGFQACGKSYFGKLLASKINWSLLETDSLIEASYEKSKGQKSSCREIFLRHGVTYFRNLESEVIKDLCFTSQTVVSLGGGAILNEANLPFLKKGGVIVFLDTDKSKIKKRIFEKGVPSFLDPKDPQGSFEKVYAIRYPIYYASCDLRLSIGEKSDDQILFEILSFLSSQKLVSDDLNKSKE